MFEEELDMLVGITTIIFLAITIRGVWIIFKELKGKKRYFRSLMFIVSSFIVTFVIGWIIAVLFGLTSTQISQFTPLIWAIVAYLLIKPFSRNN